MRWIVPCLLLVSVVVRVAHADPTDLTGGVLIVHAPPGVEYSLDPPPGGWCQNYLDQHAISDSYDQNNRVDPAPGTTTIWFLLAAWGEPKEFCSFEFGLGDFDPGLADFVSWEGCGAFLTIPTPGWPGPNEGIAMAATGDPWAGDYVPVMRFATYAHASGVIPLSVCPTSGLAVFYNCSPVAYDIACLGALGIQTDGTPCYLGPPPPMYACCSGELCQIRSQTGCSLAGGSWLEGLASCDPNPCISYACCTGEVCQVTNETDCVNGGGDWLEGTESCDPDPCVTHACCVDQQCQVLRQEECTAAGGIWLPGADGCVPDPCRERACCQGPVCRILREADCAAGGGEWRADVTSCDPDPCVPRACCLGESCAVLAERDCLVAGGVCHDTATECTPDPCLERGCCLGDSCFIASPSDCAAAGGRSRSLSLGCDPSPCGPQTFLIRPDGTGDFPTIQAGIDACYDGDTLELADGTFTGTGNAQFRYDGKAIRIRSQGGVPAACILDGEGVHAPVVTFDAGEGPQAGLEGVTITRGVGGDAWGGAIFTAAAAPTLRNLVVRDCQGVFGAVAFDYGQPTLVDAVITNNHGTYCGGVTSIFASPTLQRVTFVDNGSVDEAGAVLITTCDRTTALISDCTFYGNGSAAALCVHACETVVVTIENSIIAFSSAGEAYRGPCEAVFTCCDFFGNAGGDWTGCIAGQLGQNGNISEDPLFCGTFFEDEDCRLLDESPCALENNPGCGQIGARPVGCSLTVVNAEGSGDYETIQDAVDAADDGDVVMLEDGVFQGEGNRAIRFAGRAIIIRTQSRKRQGVVIDCQGLRGGLIFDSGEDRRSVVDGITVMNAYADYGAAVFCASGTSPTLMNCTFINNTALEGGGGVACWGDADPRFESCTFSGNEAYEGGGAYWSGNAGGELVGCEFLGNRATRGGSAFCADHGQPQFESCAFDGDSASLGGTLHCRDSSVPVLNCCTFEGDTARYGGAVSCYENAAPVFDHCRFNGNSALQGGAAHCSDVTEPNFLSSTFVDNQAGQGGAMSCHGSSAATLVGCTVVGNGAAVGGGIYSMSSLTRLENSIIAHGTQGAAVEGTGAMCSCCDVFGNIGGDWIGAIGGQLGLQGNISQDPLFCDYAGQDYQIFNTSPCNQEPCGLIGAWPVGCMDPQGWGVPSEEATPEPRLFLNMGQPNPFDRSTRIDFGVAGSGGPVAVHLAVYDVSGRVVRVLLDDLVEPGDRVASWDGTDKSGQPVGSGLYFCRLQVGEQRRVQRILRIQ